MSRNYKAIVTNGFASYLKNPEFREVLLNVARDYKEEYPEIRESAEEIVEWALDYAKSEIGGREGLNQTFKGSQGKIRNTEQFCKKFLNFGECETTKELQLPGTKCLTKEQIGICKAILYYLFIYEFLDTVRFEKWRVSCGAADKGKEFLRKNSKILKERFSNLHNKNYEIRKFL